MSATKKTRVIKAKPPKREAPDDVPQFFRLNVEVGDLDAATSFYTKLLGVPRAEAAGTPMLLRLWAGNPASAGCFLGEPAASSGKVLVLYGQESRGIFDRAQALSCLSREEVHDAPGGASWGAPGRTIVLCRGSLGKSSLFGRRGNRLHRVATPALHTGPFRRNK